MATLTAPLEDWLRSVLADAAPAQRRALMRDLVRELRRSQVERIAAQRNPDGSAFEPRKPQPQLRAAAGKLRRTMFEKMRTPSHLKTSATAEGAEVFIGGSAGRIARVHQYGLQDRVQRGRGLTIRYPVRELLGFTEDDKRAAMQALMEHFTPR
jgi:phage virion morphogenesis protein